MSRSRTFIALCTAAMAMLVVSVAYGSTVVKIGGTGTIKKASKAKPAKFTGTWTNAVTDSTGGRPVPPKTWSWKWSGVTVNGKGFPTCTADQIDAAQSDSVCPKGSLVGRSTKFVAALGPHSDPKSSATCNGKTIRLYNGGPHTVVWFAVGPPDQCAGVSYLAPFTEELKTSGTTTTQTVTWPENITHALPGVDGALTEATLRFDSPSRKVGGKTVYYMTDNGCKGRRSMTYVSVDEAGTDTKKVDIGKCK